MLSVRHGDSVAHLVAAWVLTRWCQPTIGEGVTAVIGEVPYDRADVVWGERYIAGAGECRRHEVDPRFVESEGGVVIDSSGTVLRELGEPSSDRYSSVLVDPKRSVVRLALELAQKLGGTFTPDWLAAAAFAAMDAADAAGVLLGGPPVPLLVRCVEDFDRTGSLTVCRLPETRGIMVTLAADGVLPPERTVSMFDDLAKTIEDETTRAAWLAR